MPAYTELVSLYRQARAFQRPQGHAVTPVSSYPQPGSSAPLALIFSPHPDDECIVGALPRRLQQLGWRVRNMAVTLGSRPDRQAVRAEELASACTLLGWENEILGWTHITPTQRLNRPADWRQRVDSVVETLVQHRPAVVFCPHARDAHPAHIGTHLLVIDALALVPPTLQTPVLIETEYWGAMETPNLLVECPDDVLADLVAALACHRGEVERNPYHLSLPAWMIDNVRRGAERVGGAGQPAPGYIFGTLYRVTPPPSLARSFWDQTSSTLPWDG